MPCVNLCLCVNEWNAPDRMRMSVVQENILIVVDVTIEIVGLFEMNFFHSKHLLFSTINVCVFWYTNYEWNISQMRNDQNNCDFGLIRQSSDGERVESEREHRNEIEMQKI